VVGGAFVLEQATSPDNIITEDGDLIVTDDDIQYISKEQTVGELDHLTMEDGGQIVLETRTFTDLSVASEAGEITKINIINRGNGFTKLPLVSDSDTSTGNGATLFAASTIAPMVGHVEGISITNFGLDYTTNPSFVLNRNTLVKNVTGNFVAGDTLTSHDATVVDFDSARKILELSTSNIFNQDDTITSVTGASATVHQASPAFATSEVGVIGTTVGNFVDDRGKISVDTMKVQDSYYYQDYSYVVRIGQSINEWRESIRRSVHPAGWNVFGEVSFASQVSARIAPITAGGVGGYTGGDTFTPELASTFTNLFTTIFGRRLGTKTDGTTPRVSAGTSVASPSELTNTTRDVTLTSSVVVSMNINRGSHVTGGTLNLLPQYAFAVPPLDNTLPIPHYPGLTRQQRTNNNDGAYYTIDQFGQFRINQVSDGSGNIPNAAFNTRINVPPPGEIRVSSGGAGSVNSFSNTFMTFDNANNTFDEAVGSGNTRANSSSVYTSFDENTVNFDNTTGTFDTGS